MSDLSDALRFTDDWSNCLRWAYAQLLTQEMDAKLMCEEAEPCTEWERYVASAVYANTFMNYSPEQRAECDKHKLLSASVLVAKQLEEKD